jgi:2-polyprenyl-3-methyl-5-hydroxy-6-metoxy-1,4-benzoquinol methylase
MEILSIRDEAEFTEVWYDIAPDEHFWVRHRFEIFMQELAKISLDKKSRLHGLDIGCGHGAVQRQLAAKTEWIIDGCDLTRDALARNGGHRGKALYYDIHDRRPQMKECYDFIIMFDVIEHIADPRRFIESAAYHLRPGGFAFINVPALQMLFSKYDSAVGHLRRYDKPRLETELVAGGLDVLQMRYWGVSLVPVALLRKLIVHWMSGTDAIVRKGMEPPTLWASAILSGALTFESRFLTAPPFGASLLAIAQKPA